MHNLIESKPVPRLTLLAVFAILLVRMVRAAFVLGWRCWKLRPSVGDAFNVNYSCVIDLKDADKATPRVVEL